MKEPLTLTHEHSNTLQHIKEQNNTMLPPLHYHLAPYSENHQHHKSSHHVTTVAYHAGTTQGTTTPLRGRWKTWPRPYGLPHELPHGLPHGLSENGKCGLPLFFIRNVLKKFSKYSKFSKFSKFQIFNLPICRRTDS